MSTNFNKTLFATCLYHIRKDVKDALGDKYDHSIKLCSEWIAREQASHGCGIMPALFVCIEKIRSDDDKHCAEVGPAVLMASAVEMLEACRPQAGG